MNGVTLLELMLSVLPKAKQALPLTVSGYWSLMLNVPAEAIVSELTVCESCGVQHRARRDGNGRGGGQRACGGRRQRCEDGDGDYVSLRAVGGRRSGDGVRPRAQAGYGTAGSNRVGSIGSRPDLTARAREDAVIGGPKHEGCGAWRGG